MFSLIITVISVALVAALALATLYYGGDAYESGQAKAEAAKLRNQGQQLVAAAEFYYLQKGEWPTTIDKMVEDGFLTTVPVAQRTAIQEALAGRSWVMPVARQPLFTFDEVTAEVCSTLNQDSYGLKGILPKLQPGYMHQCFGPTKNDLLVVVGRGSLPDLVAAVNEGLLVPENVSSDPIPDPDDTGAWTVPPGIDVSGASPGPNPEPEPEPDPETGSEPEQGALLLNPASLTFGAVAIHFSATREVTVSNEGAQPVSLDAPALTGDPAFSISATTCGSSLAAGSNCVVSVSYSPSEVAESAAVTLSIAEGVSVSMTASAYNPVSLLGEALPLAKLNKPYTPVAFSDFLRVSNESTPDMVQVGWQLQGTLPSGLSFDTQTGTLAGTPTALTSAEGQDFTVVATYKNNEGQQVYTIKVGEAYFEVTRLSVGPDHSCAVSTEGKAYCWGKGLYGRLGDGTTQDSAVPKLVPGLPGTVLDISAAPSHTCAVVSGGAVYCWGNNNSGKLGTGDVAERLVPTLVSGIGPVSKVVASDLHTCAILQTKTAMCWGDGAYGKLGRGVGFDSSAADSNVPVAVLNLTDVVSLSAKKDHMCALTGAGQAYCWGLGSYGRLGDGAETNRNVPVLVAGLGAPAVSVSAGLQHSCVALADGTAKCWGNNSVGQLGDGGATSRSSVPVTVQGLSGVTSVSLSSNVSCAVANGGAFCWGQGGQPIGDGVTNSTNRLTPSPVSGLGSGVVSIASGTLSNCAITVQSGPKCWGVGQFGNGTVSSSSYTPVAVGMP